MYHSVLEHTFPLVLHPCDLSRISISVSDTVVCLTLSYVQKTISCSGPPVSASSVASPSESESSRSELISSDAPPVESLEAGVETVSPAPGGGVDEEAEEVEEGPSSCGMNEGPSNCGILVTPSCRPLPLPFPSAIHGGGPPALR